MKFELAGKNKTLEVSLRKDGDDVDIVVTDSNGDDWTVAYLDSNGLTICSLSSSNTEIETDSSDRIVYQED